jgi:hypothetical protein
MESVLVDALVHQVVNNAKRADSGYKKDAWEYAKSEVARVAGDGKVVTISHCKNKHDAHKRDWRIWSTLTSQSGFTVTADGLVDGDAEALERYFDAHPEARKFKDKGIKFADGLRQLFDGVLATGEDSVGVEDSMRSQLSSTDTDDVAESIERSSSVRPRSITPAKRAGDPLVSGPRKKRGTVNDRLTRGLQEIAAQIEAMVIVMETDHQKKAVQLFLQSFSKLHPLLLLEVVSMFDTEFVAKSFTLFQPELRKVWVQQQLLKRSNTLGLVEYNGKSFKEVMDSIIWSGSGDLVERSGEEVDISD